MNATVLDATYVKEDFREGLLELREALRSERNFLVASRVSRVLRRDRLFNKVYDSTFTLFVSEVNLSDADSTEVILGSFGDWLANGGWDKIVELIMMLLPLFLDM